MILIVQKIDYSIRLKIEFEIIEWFLFTQFGIKILYLNIYPVDPNLVLAIGALYLFSTILCWVLTALQG